jgi:hypothetical protein
MQDHVSFSRGMSAGLFLLLCFVGLGRAAEPSVRLELHVPPAETYVIGDAIPLFFRFENRETHPLAFMWEGCCRFNGKLTVTRGDELIPPTPPGQALAHMFAKAERLDPGVPKDFDTRLSDWVWLTNTGTYTLRGHYQGVLPFQRPQVQRGLELWRGTADSPPLQVTVLSVADYLAQRDQRSQQRGLRLELSGPAVLPPLQPAPLTLTVLNRSAVSRQFVWPDDFQLWIVNTAGMRVLNGTDIEAPREEVTLPARDSFVREVPFDSRRLEGEPWGLYRVFVEIKERANGAPRTPSNPLSLRWELNADQVQSLLQQAAAGHQTGLRNAPLKLLRVYVAEIVPALDRITLETLSAEAARLASQLRLAGCLKPLQPQPGLMGIEVRVPSKGSWQVATPGVAACLGDGATRSEIQLAGLLAVRRHLGWEIAVTLRPEEGATMDSLRSASQALAGFRAELTGEPRAVIPLASNRVSTLAFPAVASPANLIIRLKPDRTEAARRLPDAANPTRQWIDPEQFLQADLAPIESGTALEALIGDGLLSAPRIVVLASARLSWREFLGRLRPLLDRGIAADVIVE